MAGTNNIVTENFLRLNFTPKAGITAGTNDIIGMSCDQILARYKVGITGASTTGVRIPGQNQIVLTEWSLANVAYTNNYYYVGGKENSPDGLFFINSTTFVICGSQWQSVMKYAMSTGWAIATSSWVSPNFAILEDSRPEQVCFNAAGTKMFLAGSTTDKIHSYNLSVPFDLSTIYYTGPFSIAAQEISVNSMAMSPDGTKMFILGSANDRIYQYTLSTAFNLSTASYDNKSLYVGAQETVPTGMAFKDDGKKVIIVGNANGGKVWQYSMSTAWDVSTGAYDNLFFDATTQATSPTEVFIGDGGTKMYILDQATSTIYQYSLN